MIKKIISLSMAFIASGHMCLAMQRLECLLSVALSMPIATPEQPQQMPQAMAPVGGTSQQTPVYYYPMPIPGTFSYAMTPIGSYPMYAYPAQPAYPMPMLPAALPTQMQAQVNIQPEQLQLPTVSSSSSSSSSAAPLTQPGKKRKNVEELVIPDAKKYKAFQPYRPHAQAPAPCKSQAEQKEDVAQEQLLPSPISASSSTSSSSSSSSASSASLVSETALPLLTPEFMAYEEQQRKNNFKDCVIAKTIQSIAIDVNLKDVEKVEDIKKILSRIKEKDSSNCPICSKKISTKSGDLRMFLTHVLRHLKIKHLECDKCSEKFCDLSHLRRHKKTHTGEKPHQCPYCPHKDIQKSNLEAHILRNHACELDS